MYKTKALNGKYKSDLPCISNRRSLLKKKLHWKTHKMAPIIPDSLVKNYDVNFICSTKKKTRLLFVTIENGELDLDFKSFFFVICN